MRDWGKYNTAASLNIKGGIKEVLWAVSLAKMNVLTHKKNTLYGTQLRFWCKSCIIINGVLILFEHIVYIHMSFKILFSSCLAFLCCTETLTKDLMVHVENWLEHLIYLYNLMEFIQYTICHHFQKMDK